MDEAHIKREVIIQRYAPFSVQNVHPFTLFSLPLSEKDRSALRNEAVTLTKEGFRGTGPESRGKKRLAFLVGGSTAFGWLASSDDATISGQLNRIQDTYHFVNAGVPSFNTTQELHRVTDELLEFHPSLIVSFDGANDVIIASGYVQLGREYPIGTPENFDLLEGMTKDLKGGSKKGVPLLERFFPRLNAHLQNFWMKKVSTPKPPELPPGLAEKIADRYRWNVQLMKKLTESFHGRFVAVLQPMNGDNQTTTLYKEFRDRVSDISIDLLDVFAGQNPEPDYPWKAPFFTDSIHLTDKGNRIVAENIWSKIR